MLQLSRWKIILVAASVVFGILFSLPNVLSDGQLAQLPGFLPHQRLNLGLDLQGGSSLLYEIDETSLKKERLNNIAEEASSSLHDAQVVFSNLTVGNDAVTLKIVDPTQISVAMTALGKVGGSTPGAGRAVTVTRDPAGVVTIALTPQALQADMRSAVAQSIEIIRRRIDTLGTKEPDIRQQGASRITIEAPGVSDPQKLKDVIGQTGKLTFQM